ncbi:hypothetical protein ElyMa_005874100 [Elysia marginata]|uniref:Uncharacterized protein n=1 Tax=Elysia marginata TaxID=1093978 RepID=A0AAV4G1D5_9GAST|nr:hypothetical protein ElyMa_005874100 [Elysia marginata]
MDLISAVKLAKAMEIGMWEVLGEGGGLEYSFRSPYRKVCAYVRYGAAVSWGRIVFQTLPVQLTDRSSFITSTPDKIACDPRKCVPVNVRSNLAVGHSIKKPLQEVDTVEG